MPTVEPELPEDCDPYGPAFIVNVGFAGARDLLGERQLLPDAQQAAFVEEIARHLRCALQSLPERLGLTNAHVLCGVSQIAVGGDRLFADACAQMRLPHRVLLPQPLDVFLDGTSESGMRDFTLEQRELAAQSLVRPNVIEVTAVANAHQREDRFEQANLAIVQSCDVAVCLLPKRGRRRRGGTAAFLRKALEMGRPVLAMYFGGHGAELSVRSRWLTPRGAPAWTAPTLAAMGAAWPTPPEVPRLLDNPIRKLERIKALGGKTAKLTKFLFKSSVTLVILAHVAATAIAAGVVVWASPAEKQLLVLELVLLGLGFGLHSWIHYGAPAQRWALWRVGAEAARAAVALSNVRCSMASLSSLPFPGAIRPLLDTVFVLQAIAVKSNDRPFEERRAAYLRRLLGETSSSHADRDGQIQYYTEEVAAAARGLAFANAGFYFFALLAIAIVAAKLAPAHVGLPIVPGLTAFVSVVAPVFAAALLSSVASRDLEARRHTFAEILSRLRIHARNVEMAHNDVELATFALQIERDLLGETASWATRRAFTEVS